MTHERYVLLSHDDSAKLTTEEIQEGWHFCAEFDSLLVGPAFGELEFCSCLKKDHPVYLTKPPIADAQNAPMSPEDHGAPEPPFVF